MQNGQEIFTEKGVLLTHEQCNMYQEMFAREKEHETEILYLKQELAQLKRMIFGSKSEKCIGNDPSQLTLGLDVEPEEHPEKETQQITYTLNKTDNKKGSAIRLALPSHLHREEHIIEPGEDVTIARKIGKVVTEVLEYTPGKFYVERYVRPKYLPPKKIESLSENFPFCPY